MMNDEKILNVVKDIKIKNYTLIKSVDNLFIWKLKDKGEYIRLCLISSGWHENKVYYWNLELSFKPFNYKHNHRENAEVKSLEFKEIETDKCFNYFLNLVAIIKEARK